jgi:cellulose biosynthesis protein BcsQ
MWLVGCDSVTPTIATIRGRAAMKSLVFFNNKGGVGKTTLACNMAAHIAKDAGLRVLVVDLDPQCNATQLLLSDTQWDTLYANRQKSTRRTVLKVLRHIRAGDSAIDDDLDTLTSRRFGVDVLPGHPSLSMVEDRLSSSWVEFQAGTPGGARRSMWVSNLIASADYDLVVLDVGPSLGALNRTVLLGSDGFVTPMAADLFSLYALDNIGDWIKAWARDYRRGYQSLMESDADLEDLKLVKEPSVLNGFVGYTVQQYVTKAMGGASRSVNAYERYRRQIPERAETLTELAFPDVVDADLGVVPNMFSMIPLAQAVHAPIRELTTRDGVRGAQVSQQERYVERLEQIAARLMTNLGVVQS